MIDNRSPNLYQGQSPTQHTMMPGHRHQTLAPVILGLAMFKLALVVAFYYFYVYTNGHQMIAAMRDQFDYLRDIAAIQNDFNFLFEADTEYYSNNTLYSRIVGVIANGLSFLQAPIVSAVLINSAMHIFAAVVFTKLYLVHGGRYPRIFLIAISLSPTLTAYSFFALRDLMIVAVYGYFIYTVYVRAYVLSGLVIGLFLVLRPLFVAYSIFAAVLIRTTAFVLYSQSKGLALFMAIFVTLTLSYTVLHVYDAFFVFNLFTRSTFEVDSALLSTFGYGAFFAGDFGVDDGTVAGRGANIQARIMMIDSIILPSLFVLGSIYLLVRGTSEQKHLVIVTLTLLLALSFSYLSIQGNFPFRKLLPVFPLFFVAIFLAAERLLPVNNTLAANSGFGNANSGPTGPGPGPSPEPGPWARRVADRDVEPGTRYANDPNSNAPTQGPRPEV